MTGAATKRREFITLLGGAAFVGWIATPPVLRQYFLASPGKLNIPALPSRIDQHARIEQAMRVERALGGLQRLGE
jgi:hypothetical protein